MAKLFQFPNRNIFAIKNEKRIASFWLTPKINNEAIVIPDLEIPGNNANIWNIPAIKAIWKVIFFDLLQYLE